MYNEILGFIAEENHKLKKLLMNYNNADKKVARYLTYGDMDTIARIKDIISDIIAGKVDPKQDWDYDFAPRNKEALKYEQIEYFRSAIMRQIAFIHVILDYKADLAISNDTGIMLENKMTAIIQEAQSALRWGFAFWSAYHISETVAKKKIENIPSKGGQATANKYLFEAELLEYLVKTNIIKQRPPKGWQDEYNCAATISKILVTTIKENDFPLEDDSEKLYNKILDLIEKKNAKLRKAYMESAK